MVVPIFPVPGKQRSRCRPPQLSEALLMATAALGPREVHKDRLRLTNVQMLYLEDGLQNMCPKCRNKPEVVADPFN